VNGDASMSPSTVDQGKHLTPGLCGCGCGRQATKASDYAWSYWCDPAVSEGDKLAARRMGGRRGSMTPAEVSRVLDGADLDTREGRQQLRDRFLRLRLAGRIGTGVYQDILRAVDGAAKDVERTPKAAPAAAIVVEVQKYDRNGHAEPQS